MVPPPPENVENTRTVVTDSPVPSDIDSNSATAVPTSYVPTTTTAALNCPLRASGRVCVCAPCEAARERLLDRKQGSFVSHNKRKTPDESSNSNGNNDGNIENGDSKRRSITTSNPSASSLPAPSVNTNNDMTEEERIAKMSSACRTILECIGEDPKREGLLKTPERWAKALLFMCKGYGQTPAQVTNNAVFSESHNEMVVVRNIDIHSLCEHHMVPFTGRVHIGYIPNGQIVGLSKLARISEVFARRLQVQERLTRQIADAVVETVQPLGVAVVVECTHFCMVLRGVQKTSAVTTTSSVRGCFETNPKTRAEFFSILQNGKTGGSWC